MKRYFGFILLAIIGCESADNLPSEDLAIEKLEKQYNRRHELFEVGNFKKTNGVKGNKNGIDFYEMEYTADLLAGQDIHEYTGVLGKQFVSDTSRKYEQIYDNGKGTPGITILNAYKKGEKIKEISGKILFVKKENGWE